MAPPTTTSVMTGSGRYFDPYNPTPESVHLPDVARGLRRGVASRFNGQLIDPADCPHPQSGIAHSMRVGRIVHWLALRDLDADLSRDDIEEVLVVTLAGLLHDAPEGYVGDALGPIKSQERKAMEDVVLSAIAVHVVGPDWAPHICGAVHDHRYVRWADTIALYQEALLYQPGAEDWALPEIGAGDANCGQLEIARTLHLFHPREGEDWMATIAEVARLLQDFNCDPGNDGLGWWLRRVRNLVR